MSSPASVSLVQNNRSNVVSYCGLAIIAALVLGVGPVSSTILHHIVQTLPFWVIVALRRRSWTSWFALPCFIFWLVIMAAIWAFLLHLPTFVNGHFSPVEIAMTIIVGIASLGGIIAAIRTRGVGLVAAIAAFVFGAAAQFGCFWLSEIPFIWRH
jgi:hypothetical protein